jgi:hypothetical protein
MDKMDVPLLDRQQSTFIPSLALLRPGKQCRTAHRRSVCPSEAVARLVIRRPMSGIWPVSRIPEESVLPTAPYHLTGLWRSSRKSRFFTARGLSVS